MRVNVRLLGWMREFLADGIAHFDDQDFDLAAGTTLQDLVDRFGFQAETAFMVMRNGDRVLEDDYPTTPLADADKLVFLPPLKGG